MMTPANLAPYLEASPTIDFRHPAVLAQALKLAAADGNVEKTSERCFRFVRDEIRHSWDYRQNPITCMASDVLQHETGYCYAKSHLLAALLRANGIPAGFCYQRLSVSGNGAPYCLHGLNAIWLGDHGWHRVDARGNKPGVAAEFCPPREQLAFPIASASEADLPGIHAEPHPHVLAVLASCGDITEVHARLPDIDPADWAEK